ncbi:MAG TPA: ABC transporter substrate-binding protein, partial [Candidatus Nitrosotalea sp.]|nr:ABC transporter substrate-binding protein [Candidatus Nitrosotalea sp.]
MNAGIKFGIAGAIIGVVIVLSLISHPLLVPSQSSSETTGEILRIGYFPNINHAQAVIGVGNGDFQNALGNVKIESQVFNAGPDEVEALFANRIDVAYVGPNPAINGYLKSDGGLKIIAGVSSGGAVFVIRNDSGIETVHDFAGKKFASPQLGNTQDVALRSYLLKNGYKTSENGGNVTILPAKTSDIVTMMSKKDIDGAWVP